MIMEKVKTRTAEIWKDGKGIVWMSILEGALIDKEDAADNILVIKKISNNKPVLRILDSRKKWDIAEDGKIYSEASFKHSNTIAYAILVSSFTDKLVKNFLLKFNRPEVPFRTFNSEQEALNWLLEFRK